MTDANLFTLRSMREPSYNTLPSSGSLQELRITGESLKQETGTVESAEIVSTGDIKEFIRNSVQGGGGIDWEMSYSTWDEQLEELLRSAAFTAEVSVDSADTDIAITSVSGTGGTCTHTTAWANTPTAGEIVEFSGFAGGNVGNNGYARVTGTPSSTSFDFVRHTGTPVNASAGDSVTITQMGRIRNGTTLRHRIFEKDFGSGFSGDRYTRYRGYTCATGSMAINAQAVLTGSFGYIGRNGASSATDLTSDQSLSAVTAATTTAVMQAVDDVPRILENGGAYTVAGLTMAVDNGVRPRIVVGEVGPESIGQGTFRLTGTHLAFFETQTVMDSYRNFTTSGLFFVVEDSSGNAYVFDIPSLKYTDGQALATGVNTDITAEMTWGAFRDATLGYTMQIAKVAGS